MQVLFASTGVQIVCIPLRGGSRYQTSQVGYGHIDFVGLLLIGRNEG